MFAVIHTGGKQHRVAENDRIIVERLPADPGSVVSFDKVLMLAGDGASPLIGDNVPGEARVFGQVLEQKRGDKIIVFKKKRRQGYRRKRGHRQYQTVIRIVSISADGEEPTVEPLEAETSPVVNDGIDAEPTASQDTSSDTAVEDQPVAEEAAPQEASAEETASTAEPDGAASESGSAGAEKKE